MNDFKITDEELRKALENVELILISTVPKEDDIDYTFSKNFENKMKKLIKQETKKTLRKNIYNYSRNIVAALLIIIIGLFAMTMSVDAMREQFFNVIKEVYTKFTTYKFSINENIDMGKFNELNLSYLPKGFKEIDRINISNETFIFFSNDDGDEIVFNYSKIADTTMKIDTEEAIIESVKINGIKAEYIIKNNEFSLIWNDNIYSYYITLSYIENIKLQDTKNEIIKIAENIK
ncbi:DUF4367 domain-containing protein [Clostridioides sp. GD02377]|uniref:DUF4367 domain-containing protein n=1 Tax=unclassified Clostridioides TaxID=2635829 RepID=UPI0038AC76DB